MAERRASPRSDRIFESWQDEHDIDTVHTVQEAARRRDAPDYREIIEQLTEACDAPVVMVNRLPENSRWLDALELGAVLRQPVIAYS